MGAKRAVSFSRVEVREPVLCKELEFRGQGGLMASCGGHHRVDCGGDWSIC